MSVDSSFRLLLIFTRLSHNVEIILSKVLNLLIAWLSRFRETLPLMMLNTQSIMNLTNLSEQWRKNFCSNGLRVIKRSKVLRCCERFIKFDYVLRCARAIKNGNVAVDL